jgi:hypothetical protein
MSLLNCLRDGTLIGKERLMQAREFYAPSRSALTPDVEFARWTQRIAIQNELGSAREMAGLSDLDLDVLEKEFIRCQTRAPSAWARHGIWVGALLIAISCVVLASSHIIGTGAGAIGTLKALGAGVLFLGAASIAISGLTAFSSLQLDLNHGTTACTSASWTNSIHGCTRPSRCCGMRQPRAIGSPFSKSAARCVASTTSSCAKSSPRTICSTACDRHAPLPSDCKTCPSRLRR